MKVMPHSHSEERIFELALLSSLVPVGSRNTLDEGLKLS